jgi:hypothetical protein
LLTSFLHSPNLPVIAKRYIKTMQNYQGVLNLEKFMGAIVVVLFVLTTLMFVLLYSNSNTVSAKEMKINFSQREGVISQ